MTILKPYCGQFSIPADIQTSHVQEKIKKYTVSKKELDEAIVSRKNEPTITLVSAICCLMDNIYVRNTTEGKESWLSDFLRGIQNILLVLQTVTPQCFRKLEEA
jgi:hypothetical protein